MKSDSNVELMPAGQPLVQRALYFATKAHQGQLRKDGKTPYIEHPKAVAAGFLAKYRKDWCRELPPYDEFFGQAVALLHDTIEDTEVTINDLIKAGFGGDIWGQVSALTHKKANTYLDYILNLKKPENRLARYVKFCDMEANLADLKDLQPPAARKNIRVKYELAHYILVHCR